MEAGVREANSKSWCMIMICLGVYSGAKCKKNIGTIMCHYAREKMRQGILS
jgi:hypothetical protein